MTDLAVTTPPERLGLDRRRAPPPSQQTTTRRLTALGLIVVGLTGVLSLVLAPGGFTATDYLHFQFAQRAGLSVAYLLSTPFDHFVPGHRLANWLLQSWSPLNADLAHALIALVFVAILLVFHRLVAELFGAGTGPLLLTLVFGASVIQMGMGIWWAAAISRMPAELLALASILLYVRFERTQRVGLVIASVALLGFALAFSEDVVYVPVGLVGLKLLVLDADKPLGQALRALRERWWVYAVYLLPVAISTIGLSLQKQAATHVQSPVIVLRYLTQAWFTGFVPALFGLVVNEGRLNRAEVVRLVFAQLALVALVAWTLWRHSSAWRSWVYVGTMFLVTQAPVGLLRAGGVFSLDEVARKERYYSGLHVVFVIALGAAVLQLRRSLRTAARPDRPATERRLASPAAIVALLAAYVGCSLWSSFQRGDQFAGRPARPYVDRLRAGVAQLEASGRNFGILDEEVPDFVIQREFAPFNRLDSIVPLITDARRLTTDAPETYRVTESGRLEPVKVVDRGGGTAATLSAHELVAAAPAEALTQTADGGACVTTGREEALLSFRLPAPTGPGDLYLVAHYRSAETSLAYVLVDRGAGLVDDLRAGRTDLDRRGGEVVVALGGESVSGVSLILPRGSRVCIADISVRSVEPAR